jgi:hypothetical protein
MMMARRASICTVRARKIIWAGWIVLCLGLMVGCGQNMYHQPRYDPLEPSEFFPDGKSARDLVPGTVARGQLDADGQFYTEQSNGEPVDAFPFPISREDLERGQDRYNVFCAPCHGLAGYGNGMIVQRGFSPPPSFHSDRLRDAPLGRYFDVITNGFGRMYAYGYRVAPDDRWRIIAYIRALQLSQNATLEDVPAQERQELQGAQESAD